MLPAPRVPSAQPHAVGAIQACKPALTAVTASAPSPRPPSLHPRLPLPLARPHPVHQPKRAVHIAPVPISRDPCGLVLGGGAVVIGGRAGATAYPSRSRHRLPTPRPCAARHSKEAVDFCPRVFLGGGGYPSGAGSTGPTQSPIRHPPNSCDISTPLSTPPPSLAAAPSIPIAHLNVGVQPARQQLSRICIPLEPPGTPLAREAIRGSPAPPSRGLCGDAGPPQPRHRRPGCVPGGSTHGGAASHHGRRVTMIVPFTCLGVLPVRPVAVAVVVVQG